MKYFCILIFSIVLLSCKNKSTPEGISQEITSQNSVQLKSKNFVCGDLIYDKEGNQYGTVKLGNQCWMAENLNIGTLIEGSEEQEDNKITEKYCLSNDLKNCNIYGGLYQWNEMMQYDTIESAQGICPDGWHIPSDDEFKMLEISLGMSQSDADLLNFRGTDEGSQIASNAPLWYKDSLVLNKNFGTSGFNVIPGEIRHRYGNIKVSKVLTYTSIFWTSSGNSHESWYRSLYYHNSRIERNKLSIENGHSVRCVKD